MDIVAVSFLFLLNDNTIFFSLSVTIVTWVCEYKKNKKNINKCRYVKIIIIIKCTESVSTNTGCLRKMYTHRVSQKNVHTQGVSEKCTHTGCPRKMYTHRVSQKTVHTQGVSEKCTHTGCLRKMYTLFILHTHRVSQKNVYTLGSTHTQGFSERVYTLFMYTHTGCLRKMYTLRVVHTHTHVHTQGVSEKCIHSFLFNYY